MTGDLPPVSDSARVDALEEIALLRASLIRSILTVVRDELDADAEEVSISTYAAGELERLADVVRSNHA